MTIRAARREDALGIARIHVEAWRVAYRGIVPDEFLRTLSVEQRHVAWQRNLEAEESLTFVAEEGETLLGWISLGQSRDGDAQPSIGEIWAVYVDPSQWGRGVGRELCTAAEQELRRQGFTDVTLWVLKDNGRALRFYAANRFIRDACEDRIIERGGKTLSEVRMKKHLA